MRYPAWTNSLPGTERMTHGCVEPKFMFSVMVSRVMNNESHVMLPLLFLQVIRLMPPSLCLTWESSHGLRRRTRVIVLVPSGCTFPHGPCEPGMTGQEFLLVYIWPPNASELNPLDYYIWDIIKGRINSGSAITRTH